MLHRPNKWPDGKRFAFTIFDDTDRQNLNNVPAVYDFFHDLGLGTTKSVWRATISCPR